jgi:hypothetical protein
MFWLVEALVLLLWLVVVAAVVVVRTVFWVLLWSVWFVADVVAAAGRRRAYRR